MGALVFAKEWGHLHGREDSLGIPLQANNFGQREFARVIKAAALRPITLHGLQHTSATLLLKAGVPPQVVQQRLGHKRIETLGIYAHVLPSMQQDAAPPRSPPPWLTRTRPPLWLTTC